VTDSGSDSPRGLFVTYEMADGSQVWGEYQFVTGTEWWDDREEEVRLIKRTYRLVSEEEIVLPDPIEEIEDDEDDDSTGGVA
jgi:hypothetical protein